jgi:glycerophosphoryl diester phosphodiesterase
MAMRSPSEVLRISHRGRTGISGITAESDQRINLDRVAATGAHLVELDLRATRDGQLVIHHDGEFVANGQSTTIAGNDLADLLRLVPGGLPTAAEIFAAAKQAGLGIYADIKSLSASDIGRLAMLIGSEEMADRIVLASDRTEIVALCADLAPDIPRSVLFRSVEEDPLTLAERTSANFVHPCWEDNARPDRLLTQAWLARVRKHGLGVICWHEERPEVISALLTLGVDGICTDEPALLTELASSA